MQKVAQASAQTLITQEDILVVRCSDLFNDRPAFQGLEKESLQHILQVIADKKLFLPRAAMETDPTYKQIIPYLIFNYGNRYFLMQRQAKASEQRLKNKYTLGIGGHIRQEDMQTDSIFDWARREFQEEVSYTGDLTFEVIGALNDDSNDVGKVHLGLVIVVRGNSDKISVKSELKSGSLLSLAEIASFYEHLESWSQTVYTYLIS